MYRTDNFWCAVFNMIFVPWGENFDNNCPKCLGSENLRKTMYNQGYDTNASSRVTFDDVVSTVSNVSYCFF